MIVEAKSIQEMQQLGQKIANACRGSEVIELVGDIGAGKTTLTKGLVKAFGVSEDVQSPTFTISRVYNTPKGLKLAHYDFYRLRNPGVMAVELGESIHDPETVVIIEWADSVANVLPADRLTISIRYTPNEHIRRVEVTAGGKKSQSILDKLA